MARCDHCLHSHVCEAEGWLDATNCPHFLSSADVVPREEVEKLKVERAAMRSAANSYKMHYQNIVKEIFEEIETALTVHAFTSKSEDYIEGACDTMDWVDSKLAELKKKYTEGKR